MSGHSNIGPSSAERWINCPGSVALAEKCPKPKTSEHAAWGSVAHKLGEQLLKGQLDEMGLMGKLGHVMKQDGYDIEVDDEMIDTVLFYRDTVHELVAEVEAVQKPAAVTQHVEVKVFVKSVDPDLWGTSDFVVYRKGHKLIVVDLKGGKGKPVEVEENPQAGLYALGTMETFAGEAFDEIELVIIQPRCAHSDGAVRRWVASKEWLAKLREQARAAIAEARGPNPRLKAGDHCRWCPAKPLCPEIHDAASKQAQVDFTAIAPAEAEVKTGQLRGLPDVKLLTREQLAQVLDWRDAIEAWLGSVDAHVLQLLENGQEVPGYKLVEGKSNRRYVEGGDEAVAALFAPLHGEKVYQKKVLSPSQMEKLVGKKVFAERAAGYVEKPQGKLKVAKASDPRRLAPTSAQVDFDPLEVPSPLAIACDAAVPSVPASADDPLDGAFAVEGELVDPLAVPQAAVPLEDELLGPRGGTSLKKEPIWPI